MKKPAYIIFITVFLLMCAAPFAGMLLGFKNVNAEKRQLAAMPAVIDGNGLNTEFTTELNAFINDNFAFRPNLITMHAYASSALFGESVVSNVIIGRDGWLFFKPTLKDFMRSKVLSDNEIYRLVKTLELQRDYLKSRGIGFIFMVAPNKASIYGRYMPERYTRGEGKNTAEKLHAAFGERGFDDYIDLFEVLNGQKVQVYHKHDSHWNNTGALIAYNEIMARIAETRPGFSYNSHEGKTFEVKKNWAGDLSAMLYPAGNVLDEQHVYDIPKEYTTKRPVRSYEDLLIQAQTDKQSLDLVFFRDSFANALIPIMSNEFASVTYSRGQPWDYGLVTDTTDVVAMEIAERNIGDLLLSAPVMVSPEIALETNPARVDMDIDVKVEDEGGYVRIMGIALPPGYERGWNYDIFVRLNSLAETHTFRTFPILEQSLEADEGYSNTAFSLLVEKAALRAGDYNIEVIVSVGKGYVSGIAGESVRIKG